MIAGFKHGFLATVDDTPEKIWNGRLPPSSITGGGKVTTVLIDLHGTSVEHSITALPRYKRIASAAGSIV